MKIEPRIVQEADDLSKSTGIPFRDCLEVLYKAYLKGNKETLVGGWYRVSGIGEAKPKVLIP